MKILSNKQYEEMQADMCKALKLLDEGMTLIKKLQAENDCLRAIIKADNIDFPNSEERSKTTLGNININDIYNL